MSTKSLQNTFIVVAELWIVDGQRPLFDQYETRAVAILRKYGGQLVSAQIVANSTAENPPDEIHTLSFPSEHSFTKFKNDEAHTALADMRKKCISKTEIHTGFSNAILK